MQIQIDQGAYKEASQFPLLEVGDYLVTLAAVKEDTAEQGKYLQWELNVIHPDYPSSKLWLCTSLAQKYLWKLKELCGAVGYQPVGSTLDTNKMIGKTCMVKVFHKEYNGRMKANVGTVSAATPADKQQATSRPEAPVPATETPTTVHPNQVRETTPTNPPLPQTPTNVLVQQPPQSPPVQQAPLEDEGVEEDTIPF